MRAVIALGSNLGDRERHIRDALDALHAPPAAHLLNTSALYRTAAMGSGKQSNYCNAVAEIDTSLRPLALLDWLQSLETEHGRSPAEFRREGAWTPRELDLDILLLEQRRLDSQRLKVPHPRLAERAFVLVPLADLGADREVPGLGSVHALLAKVDRIGVRPWGNP